MSGAWTLISKLPDDGRTEEQKRWLATMLVFIQPALLWFAFTVYAWLGTL
jgi:hypothetical protein